MKIAIDFDGVIIERKGIPREGEWEHCWPMKDSWRAINWLLEQKYDLYILTNRLPKDWPKIKKWLKKFNFPDLKVTNIKELGTTLYIDDRAVRFTNWQDICKYLG